jgi:uncharacterized protein with PIN domain
MNKQEAIHQLKAMTPILMRSSECTLEMAKAQELAISALEKQIPKKINKSSFNVAFCPVCHGSVWQIRNESKYCFRCGQALNWRLEDE